MCILVRVQVVNGCSFEDWSRCQSDDSLPMLVEYCGFEIELNRTLKCLHSAFFCAVSWAAAAILEHKLLQELFGSGVFCPISQAVVSAGLPTWVLGSVAAFIACRPLSVRATWQLCGLVCEATARTPLAASVCVLASVTDRCSSLAFVSAFSDSASLGVRLGCMHPWAGYHNGILTPGTFSYW